MKVIRKKKRFMKYRQRMKYERWIGMIAFNEDGRVVPLRIKIMPWWNHVLIPLL